MSRTFIVIVLSLLAVATGCVPNRAYRTGVAGQRPPVQLAPTSQNIDLRVITTAKGACPQFDMPITEQPRTSTVEIAAGKAYDLAIMEYDEEGEPWTIGNLCNSSLPENSQLATAVALIKMRKQDKTRPVFVITFIHGWKNNASENNEERKNLAGFKQTLQSMAERYPSLQFIGVFVGWRGQVIAADSFLSYWNRRDTANRIAGPSMTEALFTLMFATRPESALEDPCATAARPDDDSHFVLVGHSFGGRILERAVAQPYMAMLVERAARQQAGCGTERTAAALRSPGFRPPADLIVFLNPAADSLEGKAMIEGMMRLNIKTEPEGPLFLSISSQSDSATRTLMPLAQWTTLAGNSSTRKDYGNDAPQRGQIYQKKKDKISQRRQSYYFNNSEANVPEMRTHSICLISSRDCSPRDSRYEFTVGTKSYLMKPRSEAWNNTPFWVIHSPGSLIRNHWDIFNSDVTGFLTWLIQKYGMGQTRIVIQ